MPRILVADDHDLMRRHVREILEHEKGWKVCAEAATGREAIALATKEHPDIAVLDLCMPDVNGLEAARQIHEQFPQTVIVIITMYDPLELTEEVAACGVQICLLKTDLHNLVAAVRKVFRQGRNFSSAPANAAAESHDNPHEDEHVKVPGETLTEVEREIVRMLALAKSPDEIAAALSITVQAVGLNRAAIMRKLNMNSVFELVQYAVRMKLVETKSKSKPFLKALP
jgi:DNA-binding NarL/FixJ family response regulator